MNNQMNDPQLTLEDELLLQTYLDGELSPAESRQFAARLAAEPALRAASEQWRNLLAEFDHFPEPHLSRDMSAEVMRRLSPQPLPVPVWRPLLLAQAILAALLALLAWPLLAALAPTARHWTPPDWVVLLQGWQTAVDTWQLTVSNWTAVWRSAVDAWPLSFSLLLPLAALAAVMWLIHVRYLWRSAPAYR